MFFFSGLSSPWMLFLVFWLIIRNISYYLTTPGAFLALIYSIPGMLIAITFHEFAHAWVADKLGDDTPRRQGRLSLNPLKHLDPVGTILLLTAGFGWGKPVEINPNNFNRTVTIRKGNALVSLAGPLMNIILAIIFSIIYGLFLAFGENFMLTTTGTVIGNVLSSIISINVGLGVFNLIPLPPLDGSKIIVALLPTRARTWYMNHQSILYLIFVIAWVTPLASMVITPIINFINEKLFDLITMIVKLGA